MIDATTALARSLGAEDANRLLPYLDERELQDGEVLLREGVPSSHVYFVVDGKLVILHETLTTRVELAERGPGSWIGEVGLIDQGPATATVTARGDVRVLCMSHDRVVRLTRDEPAAASVLLRHASRTMAERLAEGSAGLVEEVAPGVLKVTRPEQAPGLAKRLLSLLLGGAA